MKILIVGTPRSGTTSLLNVLSNACKLNKVFEPFNYDISNNYKFPLDLENSIVKICPFQTPKEYGTHSDFFKFVKEYYLEFDKTILITRKDKDEHLISWHNSISKNQLEKKEDLQIYFDVMYEISDELSIPLVFYEDLYGEDRNKSLDIINNWNLPINSTRVNEYLHPKFKYRKSDKKNII